MDEWRNPDVLWHAGLFNISCPLADYILDLRIRARNVSENIAHPEVNVQSLTLGIQIDGVGAVAEVRDGSGTWDHHARWDWVVVDDNEAYDSDVIWKELGVLLEIHEIGVLLCLPSYMGIKRTHCTDPY